MVKRIKPKKHSLFTELQELKLDIFLDGISISEKAEKSLSNNGLTPISLFEYPTTAGVSIKLSDDLYVNGKFHGKFNNPKIKLDFIQGKYHVFSNNKKYQVELLPLPDYFDKKNKWGVPYRSFMMSHTDRLRVSPINSGCAFNCKYCDLNLSEYKKNSIPQMIDAIDVALADKNLKVKHIMISGGTPYHRDYKWMDKMYKSILSHASKKKITVDIMLSPRKEKGYLKKLKKWGATSIAVDLEIFNKNYAKRLNPCKYAISRDFYLEFIKEAVTIFGRGYVRSALIVGLEPIKDTLKGIETMAKLGCDPVLGPFVPAKGTPLENHPAPKSRALKKLLFEAIKITEKYNVKVGPRCIPCQHNSLAVPDDSGKYYFNKIPCN